MEHSILLQSYLVRYIHKLANEVATDIYSSIATSEIFEGRLYTIKTEKKHTQFSSMN